MSSCLTFSLIICNFTLQRWFDTAHYNFVTKAFVWRHNQERYMLLKYKISHLRLLLGQWKTMTFLSWSKFSLQKFIIHVAILQRQPGMSSVFVIMREWVAVVLRTWSVLQFINMINLKAPTCPKSTFKKASMSVNIEHRRIWTLLTLTHICKHKTTERKVDTINQQ